MIEFLFTLFDIALDIFTLGAWSRSQGERSSNVTKVNL